MLFNLALAYEKNGEIERAIDILRRYQAFVQSEEQRAEVMKKIEEFKVNLRKQQEANAAEAKAKQEAAEAKAKADAEAKAKADAEIKRQEERKESEKRQAQTKRRVVQYSLWQCNGSLGCGRWIRHQCKRLKK